MGTVKSASIADVINEKMGELAAAERRVARAILAQYPIAGLETIAKLAKRANVSDPTILRFINKLGFKKYPEFQDALRNEVDKRLLSPLTIKPVSMDGGPEQVDDPMVAFVQKLNRNLTETFSGIPRTELDAVQGILSDGARKIYIFAGAFTDTAARYLYFHLHKMRKGVRLISGRDYDRDALLLDMRKQDVLIVFDVRRYDRGIFDFASRAAARGIKILLFTDQWLSPVSGLAAHVVPCKIDSLSRWDSLAGMVAVIEFIMSVYTEENWSRVKKRLSKLDGLT